MSTSTAATTEPDLAPASDDLEGRIIVTLRLLAADAVEKAGSGHAGLPMGMAPAAWVLWSRFLRFDPTRPDWLDRDRFVLSAGHGSMLLYGLLHLFGYDLTLDDIREFRQWGSRTPGHPELGHTPGVETTTGPLGQGICNAMGKALAERMLAARYNPDDGPPIVDHRTYVIASDGDVMEGASHEMASLAGHLRLGRLIVLYDDNKTTIDASTDVTYSDDVLARFAAYGWHTEDIDDGNDRDAIERALRNAIAEETRPSLIRVPTLAGYGAPDVEGTHEAHDGALGDDQLRRTKIRFGWPPDEMFVIPDDVREHCAKLADERHREHDEWERRFEKWADAHPEQASEWRRVHARRLPEGYEDVLPQFDPGEKMASRDGSGAAMHELSKILPELVGGSGDLAGSTRVAKVEGDEVKPGDYRGRKIHFGVREHVMIASLTGIGLHGGFRPYGSTFLVFSDYARPAIRLAAMMGVPAVYLFTHDSLGVGEDGPTHQPVEHVPSLRTIPNLAVLRPADANEASEAWRVALERTDGPTAIILSRQDLPVLPPPPRGVIGQDGAWIRRDSDGEPDVVLVATGSEVWKALEAADLLASDGTTARVVSMPWREKFLELDPQRAAEILPPGIPRVVVEAAVPMGWGGIAGPDGRVIGVRQFGASAPGEVVLEKYGFTAENIADTARETLAESRSDTEGT
ncbi:MAG: transketolase [Actinomycetota bacterium]|nr:transketolase [Actinomycetota bacterium]